MSKKPVTHTLTRIRQMDDTQEQWDDLDDISQGERIRKQPRDDSPAKTKQQERRRHNKEWGRSMTRLMRKRRRDGDKA